MAFFTLPLALASWRPRMPFAAPLALASWRLRMPFAAPLALASWRRWHSAVPLTAASRRHLVTFWALTLVADRLPARSARPCPSDGHGGAQGRLGDAFYEPFDAPDLLPGVVSFQPDVPAEDDPFSDQGIYFRADGISPPSAAYRAARPFRDHCLWHDNRPGEQARRACLDESPLAGSGSPAPQWPATGAWPDWFFFGDPHTNYYEGTVYYDDVRLEIWRGGLGPPDFRRPYAPSAAISARRRRPSRRKRSPWRPPAMRTRRAPRIAPATRSPIA